MVGFLPHTPQEQAEMLKTIGVSKLDDLFSAIPASLQAQCSFSTIRPEALDEFSLQRQFQGFVQQNQAQHMDSFLGGGAYRRFIPPAVGAIAGRSEFYTAYTPYQPEVSQGTLQMIYEFQTMISELTGMPVTNASVYDGANAFCEAALMALRITKRPHLLVANSVNPQFLKVLTTYTQALDSTQVIRVDATVPLAPQCQAHGVEPSQVAAVMIQQPNYFGFIASVREAVQFRQDHGGLFIIATDPFALGVLQSPGEQGADIVCGDIQQFGNSVNYGGPYGGFVSARVDFVRQLPGRLVGRSLDKNGQEAYTLTMQTREQHIRRDKATSNICTNQSLNILKATAYLSLVGPQGLKQLATVSAQRAHQLAQSLCQVSGVSLLNPDSFLYEFTLVLPVPAQDLVETMMAQSALIPGLALSKYFPDQPYWLQVAVTELNEPESLNRYLAGFDQAIKHLQSGGAVPDMTSSGLLPSSVAGVGLPKGSVFSATQAPSTEGVLNHA